VFIAIGQRSPFLMLLARNALSTSILHAPASSLGLRRHRFMFRFAIFRRYTQLSFVVLGGLIDD
jgi:hypothetical protein